MILNDVINEYEYVYETLVPCQKYFSEASKLVEQYLSGISNATTKYFLPSGNQETARRTLVGELSNTVKTTYDHTTILITVAYEFYTAIDSLEKYSFDNEELKILVESFASEAHEAIDATNAIIKAQLDKTKQSGLIPSLIKPLQKIIETNNMFKTINIQMQAVNNMMLEPLPEGVEVGNEYNVFNILSMTRTDDIENMSNSLNDLANIFDNVGRMCECDDNRYYYIRKIESGSLAVFLVAAVPIVVAVTKLFDYCYTKYMEYRKLYREDKEGELKLGEEEIKAAKKIIEISSDNSNTDEMMEAACSRILKYFKLNPEFKINNKTYKTDEDLKLLQDPQQKKTDS